MSSHGGGLIPNFFDNYRSNKKIRCNFHFNTLRDFTYFPNSNP